MPTDFPTVVPSSTSPTIVPTSLRLSTMPTTLEYYESHPKATLPNNKSISVIGSQSTSFKIVLPFFALSSGSNGVAFSDIGLTSGSLGTAHVLQGNASMPSVVGTDRVLVTAYSNFIAVDSVKRSVAVIPNVNGDSYDDLIIGDPFNSKCYVLYGTADGLVSMNKGFTIFGEPEGDLTGWSVSGAGDVNNDTIADIVIGAPFARKVGAIYVIYGRSSSSFDIYLNNLTYTSGFAMYGAAKSDYLGISVSGAGDVNRDGCDDIIVGAVMTSTYYSGAAYVVHGGRNVAFCSSVNVAKAFKITGSSYSYVGYFVSKAGDVNGDGYDDVLIGSNPQRSNMVPAAYLIYGSASESSENIVLSSLTAQQGIRISGSGMIVSYVGDVNGDKYDDIMVGSLAESVLDKSLIVYSDVAQMVKVTVKPSKMPSLPPVLVSSLHPSKRPTLSPLPPSVIPTAVPSQLPSISPSAPTFSPTVGATEPTSFPSSRPSMPTLHPSTNHSPSPSEMPTILPSEPPSDSPTEQPSEVPSVHPSEGPSIRPMSSAMPSTFVPTQIELTRVPIYTPTLRPTILELPVLTDSYISVGTAISNQTKGYQNYIVNSSETVSIYNSMGFNKFTVIPHPDAKLVIVYFNSSNDVIDLSLYPMYASFESLLLTEGSIVVNLPDRQKIHILNLHPSDIDERNFKLYEFDGKLSKKNKNIEKISAVGALIGVAAIILLFLCGFRICHGGKQIVKKRNTLVDTYHLVDFKSIDGKIVSDQNEPIDWNEDGYFSISDFSNDLERDNESETFDRISMDTDLQLQDSIDSLIDINNVINPDDTHSSGLLSDHTIDSNGDFIEKNNFNNNNVNQYDYFVDHYSNQHYIQQSNDEVANHYNNYNNNNNIHIQTHNLWYYDNQNNPINNNTSNTYQQIDSGLINSQNVHFALLDEEEPYIQRHNLFEDHSMHYFNEEEFDNVHDQVNNGNEVEVDETQFYFNI